MRGANTATRFRRSIRTAPNVRLIPLKNEARNGVAAPAYAQTAIDMSAFGVSTNDVEWLFCRRVSERGSAISGGAAKLRFRLSRPESMHHRCRLRGIEQCFQFWCGQAGSEWLEDCRSPCRSGLPLSDEGNAFHTLPVAIRSPLPTRRPIVRIVGYLGVHPDQLGLERQNRRHCHRGVRAMQVGLFECLRLSRTKQVGQSSAGSPLIGSVSPGQIQVNRSSFSQGRNREACCRSQGRTAPGHASGLRDPGKTELARFA